MQKPAREITIPDALLGEQQCTFILFWLPDGRLSYTLGWYNGMGMERLKEKLEQFPQQIRFIDTSSKPESGLAVEEFEEIERIAALRKSGPSSLMKP